MGWNSAAGLLSLGLWLSTFAYMAFAEDALQEGQQCKPGSRFKIDCNWCTCSSTGVAGCTLRGCMENYKSPDGEQCEDGAVWRRGCNVCNCANGNAVCTKMACPGEQPRHNPEPECTEGSSWKQDCNQCKCTKGLASCTRRQCRPGFVQNPDEPECTAGSSWRKDCNWCHCENNKGVCTKKACPSHLPRMLPIPVDAECTEGSLWKHECNTCRCINGHASCTKMSCEPGFTRDPNEPECEGESRWKKDCNWCHCVNGQGVCTLRGCHPPPVSRVAPGGEECTEGSSWKKDCNTCRCANGLGVCTRRGCPPGFRLAPDEPECEGDSRWKKDCNWCICVNGKGVCTQRGCGVARSHPRLRARPLDQSECTEGSVWYKDCNTCRCARGKAVCTLMFCLPGFRRDPDQPDCEGEARWKQDCNWCQCANGRGVCTLKACLSDIGTTASRQKRQTLCIPGTNFKQDCNNCTCTETGVPLCTLKACQPDHQQQQGLTSGREPECTEGSVWYERCNTCRCANGHPVCTRESCPPGYTRDPSEPDCEGESHWKKDCNWCNCANGKSVCTLKACHVGPRVAGGPRGPPLSVPMGPPLGVPMGPHPPTRRDTECTEGSVWYQDCNTCRCANGFGVCTKKACAPGYVRDPSEPECEADAHWKKDCNWCTCVDNKGVCTRRACPPKRPKLPSPEAECTEGSVWYKDCNRCQCTHGVGSCSRMACLPGFSRDPDQPECEGESSWRRDCNWCKCVDGKGVCTRRACPPKQRLAAGRAVGRSQVPMMPPGPQCQGKPEDGRWLKGCNWCSCSEGTVVCTLKACLPGYEEKLKDSPECEGNPHWKEDCNTCRCTNGVASCTRRACRGPEPPADPQAVCTEGSHWRVDCNWCSCANGVAACTLKACTGDQAHIEEPECTNGSKWRHECNQCMCVDGKSVCTKRICLTAPQHRTYTTRIAEKTDICQLPPVRESLIQCTGFFRKWTYRANEGKCEAIVYGGCGGTENLFDDQETCESTCGSGGGGSSQTEELPADAECTEGSVWYKECNTCRCANGVAACTRERCRPGFVRDPDLPECEGESRWKKDCNWCSCSNGRGLCTQMGCLSDIGDLVGRQQRCYQKPEAGPCFAYLPRFAFVPEKNRCERFYFGGCQGNENNFETPEECHSACGGDQPVLDPSCDRTRCPWGKYDHYEAMSCTPVFANHSCCPTSFECPPTSSLLEVPADKCVYEGHEYALGEAVDVDPCSADCHCRLSHDNRPRVTCANIECPDLFVPREPNCRPIYELDQCCSVDEECLEPGTPQVAQPRGVTCLWNNQTYKEGDKMYFDGQFACRQCVCTAEFSDPTGPGCKDVFCGIELRYMDRVTAGCTPINFEDGCCPIGWLCPEDAGKLEVHGATETGKHPGRCPGRTRSEAPSFGICAFTCNEDGDCPHGEMCCSTACGGTSCVAPVHDDPVDSGKACHLGELTVPLGGTVTDKEDCTTRCSCSTPPLLTCSKYRSCELAEERYKDCHDVVCQPGCDLRVNSTTLCDECHCPDETSASPRCPEIRCPHACRSTNLKKDPVTGCLSCHCDTCPPKDPITGRPPCPQDCAIEVVQNPETGCDVCRCRGTTLPMGPPATQCPRLSPGGKLPCPSDCPAGTHTVKDPETHCLKCACAPSDGNAGQMNPIIFPDGSHCFVDPVTGTPPCPMDCAVRWVKDSHGCDVCECDPDSPPLYPFHQASQ